MMSVLEVQHTKREPDCPRYQKEAGNGGDCPDRSTQLCPDADGDAQHVRARHKLAKAHDVGKILLAYPPALIDGDAARPDKPTAATDPVERDLEERDGQRGERNRVLQVARLCRLSSHLRPPEHRAAFGPPSHVLVLVTMMQVRIMR